MLLFPFLAGMIVGAAFIVLIVGLSRTTRYEKGYEHGLLAGRREGYEVGIREICPD